MNAPARPLRFYSEDELRRQLTHWHSVKCDPDQHADALAAIRKINDELDRRTGRG